MVARPMPLSGFTELIADGDGVVLPGLIGVR